MVGFSNDKGGVESYITNLCNNLDENKYEVIYCWPEMTINGKVWVCPQNRHNYIKYIRFWKKFFKQNIFDVIYYNTCDIVSVDMLRFAKKLNIPVRIIHSHNTEIQFKRRFIHHYLEHKNKKEIGNIATDLLACSNSAGKWMFPNNDFIEIKNGIDIDRYHFDIDNRKKCRKIIDVKDELVIGCVGRLDNQKNPFFSFEIMRKIIEKNNNAKCVFIGDGEYREELQKKILKANLEKSIFILGARDDVNKWYSALDCLIMPSLFEGFPFTLVEAQTSGLPCVISSAISIKVDLTGNVIFMSLEENNASEWAEVIIQKAETDRIDKSDVICRKGYSIKETAVIVEKIINNRINK